MRWTLSGRGPPPREGGLAGAVAIAIALWIPVQLAFWFAPAARRLAGHAGA